MSDEIKKITWKDFFFEIPLYQNVKFEDFLNWEMNYEIDWYSPKNNIETTYDVFEGLNLDSCDGEVIEYANNRHYILKLNQFHEITLKCRRKWNETIIYYLYVWKDYIKKVWQSPSLADMQFAELGKKYNKILERDDLKLFKKAIGLNAHGVWAGSFVYLRRIFEHLIFETFWENKSIFWLENEEFQFKHMEEKIEILKDYLPEQLVEMKKIYWILSKWVHELSEDDCLRYFSALKLSIELILDQKIEMDLKSKKDKEAQNQIQSIMQELS